MCACVCVCVCVCCGHVCVFDLIIVNACMPVCIQDRYQSCRNQVTVLVCMHIRLYVHDRQPCECVISGPA